MKNLDYLQWRCWPGAYDFIGVIDVELLDISNDSYMRVHEELFNSVINNIKTRVQEKIKESLNYE